MRRVSNGNRINWLGPAQRRVRQPSPMLRERTLGAPRPPVAQVESSARVLATGFPPWYPSSLRCWTFSTDSDKLIVMLPSVTSIDLRGRPSSRTSSRSTFWVVTTAVVRPPFSWMSAATSRMGRRRSRGRGERSPEDRPTGPAPTKGLQGFPRSARRGPSQGSRLMGH